VEPSSNFNEILLGVDNDYVVIPASRSWGRGFGMARGQIWGFSIELHSRRYNYGAIM